MTPRNSQDQPIRDTDVIGLCVAMLPVAAAVFLPLLIIPAFAEIFAGFGANLPWLTHTLVTLPPLALIAITLLLMLPPIVLAWWKKPLLRSRPLSAIVTGVMLAALWGVMLFFAMYLPIFSLGAVVG